MFSNIGADISRFKRNGRWKVRSLLSGLLSQGFQAILVYRIFRWFHKYKIPAQPFRFIFERFIEITCGISIPVAAEIGKGLRIHHFGGIIIHPTTVIGDYCTIYHNVTIGDKGGSGSAAHVGSNVLFGVGAKIIGEIEIGDNCIIGANSVVVSSVPPDKTVIGNPAKIKEIE